MIRRVRRVTAAGILAAVPLVAAAPAGAARTPPSASPAGPSHVRAVAYAGGGGDVRADYIAARLRRDPVYVTDEAPRLLGPSTAARIKADVARLGEPVYVVVALTMPGDDPDALLPLLHDRLGKDGLYLFVPPGGEGSAVRQYGPPPRAYGGGLPLDEIMLTADEELPYDRDAGQFIRRFVDLALSPDARREYDHPRRPPEPRPAASSDDGSGTELAIFLGGSGLGGLPLLALLVRARGRRAGRRRAALERRATAPAGAGGTGGERRGKRGRR